MAPGWKVSVCGGQSAEGKHLLETTIRTNTYHSTLRGSWGIPCTDDKQRKSGRNSAFPVLKGYIGEGLTKQEDHLYTYV